MVNTIAGKVIRENSLVKIVFAYKGKYYPHDEHNGELVDAYLHTGDKSYLEQLEGAIN